MNGGGRIDHQSTETSTKWLTTITSVVDENNLLQQFRWRSVENGVDGTKKGGPGLIVEDNDHTRVQTRPLRHFHLLTASASGRKGGNHMLLICTLNWTITTHEDLAPRCHEK